MEHFGISGDIFAVITGGAESCSTYDIVFICVCTHTQTCTHTYTVFHAEYICHSKSRMWKLVVVTSRNNSEYQSNTG